MHRFLLTLTLVWACPASAETLSVAALKANEKIVVTYSSSGCFHSFTKVYTISAGAEKTFEAEDLVQKWNQEKQKREVIEVVKQGSLSLSENEAVGLDLLFEFYRSNPGGGCTTVDSVQVTYRRDGREIGAESFIDGSCSRGGETGVSFSQLEQKLRKAPAP